MEITEYFILQLEKYINRTLFDEEWGIYFIKQQVGKVRNMKIEIYFNDHNPPHFHVNSNDGSIDATFRLDNCQLIQGNIDKKDRKRIEAFFFDENIQDKMKYLWNNSKEDLRKKI